MEERFVLTDAQWAKIEPHCLGKVGDPGRSGLNNRLFVEGVLWIARTGSPWRDLPPWFGKWNTVFKRYRDWVKAGVFQKLFEALSDEPGMECDDQRRCCKGPSPWPRRKRGTKSQAIGRSVTGWATKIVALTDALGNLVHFVVILSQHFDTVGVAPSYSRLTLPPCSMARNSK